MLTTNLKRAFSKDNLQRAWLCTRTNPDARYKNYFRHIYKAYSLAINKNLDDLHKRLKNNTYQPVHSTKLYVPKKSGIFRPYTLLSIEDQIVYQALANIIAEKLYHKVRHRYMKMVFGNLYAGKRSFFFYKKWQICYHAYSNALIDYYKKGFEYAASFDLTACYDSIDHGVLKYFLDTIGLEKEFNDYLCEKLKHWSASSHEIPIYQEHGIPQGPLPSGIISECVLSYFDANSENTNKVRYFRYVDDIRLMAKSEKDLRQQLIKLDLLSKNIGLFPQSSKIDIHKIKHINEEVKSISNPPEVVTRPEDPDQKKIRKRVIELSKRYEVNNDTRFKYVLGAAKPNAVLHTRLLKILKKQPHLYPCIFNNLSKSKKLTKKVSKECINLLKKNTLYASYTTKFIDALHGRIHQSQRGNFKRFCQKYFRTENPELKAIIAKVLINANSLTYNQKHTLIQYHNWWTRSIVTSYLRKDFIGKPSYETLVNKLLRDRIKDVSIVAADYFIKNNLQIHKPSQDINKSAQFSLKNAGVIGRISSDDCFISDATIEVLGSKTKRINWKRILGRKYKKLLPKFVRWRGYVGNDPTAWVNITDTINDSLLDILFSHDGNIGSYQHGNIGAALSPRCRFAKNYPDLHASVCEIHGKRLETDLSHPMHKATGKTTRYINWDELEPLKKLLTKGYLEMWRKW